jgi:hypothetical protein
MMKKLAVAAVVCGLAITAQANLLVAWQSTAGFYFPGAPGSGILSLGESAIAQLIFSTDSTADAADPNNAAGDYVSGNDTMLQEITITNTGGLYEDYAYFGAQNYDNTFQSGYVFARIFQDDTPAGGEWVFDTTPIVTQDLTPPASAQLIEMNTDTINGDPMQYQMSGVIPEPTSLALCGIGLLTLIVRKLRRR